MFQISVCAGGIWILGGNQNVVRFMFIPKYSSLVRPPRLQREERELLKRVFAIRLECKNTGPMRREDFLFWSFLGFLLKVRRGCRFREGRCAASAKFAYKFRFNLLYEM